MLISIWLVTTGESFSKEMHNFDGTPGAKLPGEEESALNFLRHAFDFLLAEFQQ